MVSRTIPRLVRFRFVNAENRVPYYQRLFQAKDGKRMWWKVLPSASHNILDERLIWGATDQKKWMAHVALPYLNLWTHTCLHMGSLSSNF
ncbi:hypothetical protein N7449_010562, partial [Penicillium cf. viridicatum]